METPDWKSIRGGLIPWSASEYYEVLEEVARLIETPRDDWDREPRGLTSRDQEAGEQVELQLNVDSIVFQIDNLLFKRYEGESRDVARSHTYRFYMLNGFIKNNIKRLIEQGLVKDEPEGIVVEEALIQVLTTAKYEATRVEDDEEVRVFDYNKVVQETKKLQAEQIEED